MKVFVPLSAGVAVAAVLGLLLGPTGFMSPADLARGGASAMWQFRAPHVALALLAGAALATGGAAMQAVLRNPLAEPYILGISGGAAMGAMLHSLLNVGGLALRSLMAFAGAVGVSWLVFVLARRGRGMGDNALILAGVMLNVFFSAVIVLFLVLCDKTQGHELFFWLMGSLSMYGLRDMLPLLPPLLLLVAALCLSGHTLNLLSLGHDHARVLGLRAERARTLLFLLVTVMVGLVVALAGVIGFVGLVAPHGLRLLMGGDHRRLLPASALAGAMLLTLCDTASRSLYPPLEIPVGAVTAFLGVPLFLWLLIRADHGNLDL